jgi:hypothetical protein
MVGLSSWLSHPNGTFGNHNKDRFMKEYGDAHYSKVWSDVIFEVDLFLVCFQSSFNLLLNVLCVFLQWFFILWMLHPHNNPVAKPMLEERHTLLSRIFTLDWQGIVTKSSSFLIATRTPQTEIHMYGVDKAVPTGCVLEDGTQIDCDIIVCCTGFKVRR